MTESWSFEVEIAEHEDGRWVASCKQLDLTEVGSSEDEAFNALVASIEAFLSAQSAQAVG